MLKGTNSLSRYCLHAIKNNLFTKIVRKQLDGAYRCKMIFHVKILGAWESDMRFQNRLETHPSLETKICGRGLFP